MKRLPIILAILAWSTFSFADFAGTGFSSPPTPIATTSVAGKVKPDGVTITVDGDGVITSTATGEGTGTVTGPASVTTDNLVCWATDNVTIKDCGAPLTNYAPLLSPVFTTPNIGSATGSVSGNAGTATALAADPADCDAGQVATGIAASGALSCTATPTVTSITAGSFVSTAADGSRYVGAANDNALAAADQAAGRCSLNMDDMQWECINSDNTVVYGMGAGVKTFSFGIDNVIDGDDVLLWKVPRALTITQVDCYASTDNVIGVLQECTAGDVTSCTDVDDTDWTVTNATSGFSVNTGFENAGIAAGAWLKWLTTSEGTTNSNKLSCTVQYRE